MNMNTVQKDYNIIENERKLNVGIRTMAYQTNENDSENATRNTDRWMTPKVAHMLHMCTHCAYTVIIIFKSQLRRYVAHIYIVHTNCIIK